jgi:hypothetical protein
MTGEIRASLTDTQPTDLASTFRPYQTDSVEEVMDIDESLPQESNDILHLRYRELQQVHEAQNQAMQEVSTAKEALEQQLTATRREFEQLQNLNTTLQADLVGCAQLQAQNSAFQTQISTLKAENLKFQTGLEDCLSSNNRDKQSRVDQIVELEHGKKKLQDIVAKLSASCDDAVDKTKAAEEREQAALIKVRHYKQLATDLQEQIDQQLLAIEEAPSPRRMDDGPLALSNAFARNPGEVGNMIADVDSHSRWTGSNTSHILFLAIANVDNGIPKGFECEISRSEDEASQTIASLLNAMTQRFDNVKAWDTFGKAVVTSSTTYVFQVLSSGTVFLGPDAVFDTFLDNRANEVVVRAPRKIKQIKRVAKARPEADKNYRSIVRYESNSENEIYESAADENPSPRQRKMPPPQLAISSVPETTTSSSRLLEEPFQATTRSGDLSDSESDESLSFRRRSVRLG